MVSRLTVNRQHSFSGRENLAWFFAHRKWIRGKFFVLEAASTRRLLPEAEMGIRFLLLAPKRSHSHAHDRNKIKRWLRAAVAEVPEFAQMESDLISRGEQYIVMLRISKPLPIVRWEQIVIDVSEVARRLNQDIRKIVSMNSQ